MNQGEAMVFTVPKGRSATSYMQQIGGEARRVGIIPEMELLLAVSIRTKKLHELIHLTAKEKYEP